MGGEAHSEVRFVYGVRISKPEEYQMDMDLGDDLELVEYKSEQDRVEDGNKVYMIQYAPFSQLELFESSGHVGYQQLPTFDEPENADVIGKNISKVLKKMNIDDQKPAWYVINTCSMYE